MLLCSGPHLCPARGGASGRWERRRRRRAAFAAQPCGSERAAAVRPGWDRVHQKRAGLPGSACPVQKLVPAGRWHPLLAPAVPTCRHLAARPVVAACATGMRYSAFTDPPAPLPSLSCSYMEARRATLAKQQEEWVAQRRSEAGGAPDYTRQILELQASGGAGVGCVGSGEGLPCLPPTRAGCQPKLHLGATSKGWPACLPGDPLQVGEVTHAALADRLPGGRAAWRPHTVHIRFVAHLCLPLHLL